MLPCSILLSLNLQATIDMTGVNRIGKALAEVRREPSLARLCGIYLRDMASLLHRDYVHGCREVSRHCNTAIVQTSSNHLPRRVFDRFYTGTSADGPPRRLRRLRGAPLASQPQQATGIRLFASSDKRKPPLRCTGRKM
jgi:hypothetical protein